MKIRARTSNTSLCNLTEEKLQFLKSKFVMLFILGSDVRSLELYYHNSCYNHFRRLYHSANTKDGDEDALKEYISIFKVKQHVDNSNTDTFPLKELEEIYLKNMASQGKDVQSHTTRFATKLESADVGLKVFREQNLLSTWP